MRSLKTKLHFLPIDWLMQFLESPAFDLPRLSVRFGRL